MNVIKIKTIFYILVSGLALTLSNASAQDEELVFLNKINAIRQAPFSYALTLGYSQSTLNAKGLAENTSFTSYKTDDFLNTLAYQLNQSAMGEDIAAEEQIPVSSRISDTGAVLEFSNYISVDAAEKIFIDDLLKKEIESGDFQSILSNSYTKAGVSVMHGTSQSNQNAWFFTICLDTPLLVPEARLMTLINQLRASPWEVVEANIINNKLCADIDPNTARALLRKMPPVFLDPALSETARIDVEAEAKSQSSNHYSVIPGYDGVLTQIINGTVNLYNDTQEEAENPIFEKLLETALDNFQESPGILNYDISDIGLAVMTTGSEDNSTSMLFSVNTGAPEVTDNTQSTPENRIYGILYIDKNKDGLYSSGEEVCSRDISVREETVENDDEDSVIITTTTDYAGRFILTLPSKKLYRFSCVSANSGRNTASFDLYRYLYKDLFLSFILPPSEE